MRQGDRDAGILPQRFFFEINTVLFKHIIDRRFLASLICPARGQHVFALVPIEPSVFHFVVI